MLDDKIRNARERLNESIITGKSYEEIYNLSVELDELIAKYYIGNDDSDLEMNKLKKWKIQYKRIFQFITYFS